MRPLNRISSYFLNNKGLVLKIIITGLFFDGLMAFIPILQGKAINDFANSQPAETIYRSVLFFILLVLFVQINRFFKRYYVRVFANHIMLSMRDRSFRNMMMMDAASFQEKTKGDIVSRNLADIADTAEGIRKVTTEIFDSLVLLLGYGTMMMILHWRLTLLSAVFIVASILLSDFLKKIIYKYLKEYKKEYSISKDLTFRLAGNALYYQSLGVSPRYLEVYQREQAELEKKSVRAMVIQGSMEPLYYAISLLSLAFVIYEGGKDVIRGVWDIGIFSSYLTTLFLVAQKASKVGKMFNAYQKAKVSWIRCQPFLNDTASFASEKPQGVPVLELQDVSFGFEKPLISHFTAIIHPSLVGIAGKIHSGKSTLLSLLTGIYDYQGSIRFCGVEMKELCQTSFMNMIAYSPQNPEIFRDTIQNNIMLGRCGDVREAAKDACFMETVRKYPKQFDEIISHSLTSLSGGERSRLSLARSLVNHPPLILLDDIFSGLDIEMSLSILRTLKTKYHSSIILIVTNQPELLREMDRIIRLEETEESR